ncbi:MAG: MFS transporter [Acidobacteriota bacterium]
MDDTGELADSEVWVLGALQCVLWGGVYYSFGVLQSHMVEDLRSDKVAISGAFSLGLLAAAGTAPWVGRLLDRGLAVSVLRWGGWGTVLGLALWSRVGTLGELYAAWALLGAFMAAGLYESTFSMVIRSSPPGPARARHLTLVTLVGGLASVVCAPWIAAMAERRGWRVALLGAAGASAAAMVLVERFVLRRRAPATLEGPLPAKESIHKRGTTLLVAAGVAGSLAAVAVATHLVPTLRERGATAHEAAWGLGLFGLSQLPGRFFLRNFAHRLSFLGWLLIPGTLQIFGLVGLALELPWRPSLVAIVALGVGSGLQTLARPFLALRAYGVAGAGRGSGGVVSAQNLARAAAPLAVAFVAERLSYSVAFTGLALVWAAVCCVAFID